MLFFELSRTSERIRRPRGPNGHGYATDGVVRGQKPDIADRSTRGARLTSILVT